MEPAAAAGQPEKPPDHPEAARGRADTAALRRAASPWSWLSAAAAGLVAVGLGGAALLVWWALAFHPAHQQLWMVPVGLVLLGTPLVAWLSLFASGAGRWLGRPPAPAPAVVLVPER